MPIATYKQVRSAQRYAEELKVVYPGIATRVINWRSGYAVLVMGGESRGVPVSNAGRISDSEVTRFSVAERRPEGFAAKITPALARQAIASAFTRAEARRILAICPEHVQAEIGQDAARTIPLMQDCMFRVM